tara:strand:+ start:26 stop:424 length:399 start_codon:yes stop_codon:yes gene_type:complete
MPQGPGTYDKPGRPKNRKKNTGETKKKNRSVKDSMVKAKSTAKKTLARTAKKMKNTPKNLGDLAKKYQTAEKKAVGSYLKDRETSIKRLKGGTQAGKAYASQHKTRMKLTGRKLDKLKKNMAKEADKRKKKK